MPARRELQAGARQGAHRAGIITAMPYAGREMDRLLILRVTTSTHLIRR